MKLWKKSRWFSLQVSFWNWGEVRNSSKEIKMGILQGIGFLSGWLFCFPLGFISTLFNKQIKFELPGEESGSGSLCFRIFWIESLHYSSFNFYFLEIVLLVFYLKK